MFHFGVQAALKSRANRARDPHRRELEHVSIWAAWALKSQRGRAFLTHQAPEEAPVSSPHLIVEREGHVVIVTMNRPEARNAFDSEMLARMADAWELIDSDADVRVAILTGAGGHFRRAAI